MNTDFSFRDDSRGVSGGTELFTRVLFKGECIANIVTRFEPSEKGLKQGKIAVDYPHITPEDYVKTYGYMAEHRRQWNNGNRINWSEEIKVDLEK